uniref:Uncharacterized protein n=1 Tax=Corethron hystrix TaxID=216773 RepID=A0A7S1BL22_9STRA|mmetsp:Transcript_30902/g.70657  ORF Transcript_30902/g.70657 Transcript_30902/m.70657 type:complete len:502 (+) Transcript_30902:58-1563(+)
MRLTSPLKWKIQRVYERIPSIVFCVILLFLVTQCGARNSLPTSFIVSTNTRASSEFRRSASTRTTSFRMSNNDFLSDPLLSTLARIDKATTSDQSSSSGRTWATISVDVGTSTRAVHVLNPDGGGTPDRVVLFLGGAALGKYPRVAYGDFLSRLSSRCNAAVLTAPYDVGLDHFSIAREAGEALREGLRVAAESYGWKTDDTAEKPSLDDARGLGFEETGSMPVYLLGHSLGAKLLSIYAGAVSGIADGISGVGLMAYNNFGLVRSASMARVVANAVAGATGRGMGAPESGTGPNVDTLFDIVGGVMSNIGAEFVPGPEDMNKLVAIKFGGSSGSTLRGKVRMFTFEDDELDCTDDFVQAASSSSTSSGGGMGYDDVEVVGDSTVNDGKVVSVSRLPGGHLTPVYFKLDLDSFDIPEEAKTLIDLAAGRPNGNSIEDLNASFGDEEKLDATVDEVVQWLEGKGPSPYNPQNPQKAGRNNSGTYVQQNIDSTPNNILDIEFN